MLNSWFFDKGEDDNYKRHLCLQELVPWSTTWASVRPRLRLNLRCSMLPVCRPLPTATATLLPTPLPLPPEVNSKLLYKFPTSNDDILSERWLQEYISYWERTGTAHPLCLTLRHLTQPLSACSVGSYTDGQVVQHTAQCPVPSAHRADGGNRLGEEVSQCKTTIGKLYPDWQC